MADTRNTKRKSSPAKASDDAKESSAKRSQRDVSDDEALRSDYPHILIPPREDDFNAKTWWMVDLDPVEETSLQGASVLVKRCMRTYNWDEAKARKVLASYRQFIILKKKYQDWNAEILSPCYLVDQMWHCHVLDVMNYCHDMMLLCGHVVGHNPDGARTMTSTSLVRFRAKSMVTLASMFVLSEYWSYEGGEHSFGKLRVRGVQIHGVPGKLQG